MYLLYCTSDGMYSTSSRDPGQSALATESQAAASSNPVIACFGVSRSSCHDIRIGMSASGSCFVLADSRGAEE